MPNRNQGFSLIELMVTLSLLAIFVSIAIPALGGLADRNRQQALRQALWTAIQTARAAAVLNHETIEICGSDDGTTCNADWTSGWLIRSVSAGRTLSIMQPPEAVGLRWKGLGGSIRFRSTGAAPLSNGTFFQCYESETAWQLKLSRQGRLRLTSASENDQDASLCSS